MKRLLILLISMYILSGCGQDNDDKLVELSIANEMLAEEIDSIQIDYNDLVSRYNQIFEEDELLRETLADLESELEIFRDNFVTLNEQQKEAVFEVEEKFLEFANSSFFDYVLESQSTNEDEINFPVFKDIGIGSNYRHVLDVFGNPMKRIQAFNEYEGVWQETWVYEDFELDFTDSKVSWMDIRSIEFEGSYYEVGLVAEQLIEYCNSNFRKYHSPHQQDIPKIGWYYIGDEEVIIISLTEKDRHNYDVVLDHTIMIYKIEVVDENCLD